MISITLHDREFDAAVTELAKTSRLLAPEVVTGQAIQLVRKLAEATRLTSGKRPSGRKTWFRMKGRARAGWWKSWIALGVFGVPKGTTTRTLSLGEGKFEDGRQAFGSTYVAMTNDVPYIDTLEAEDGILADAFAGRMADMEDEIERRYAREMARRSGR